MSGPLGPLLLKSRRVWGWFIQKTFQGLHFFLFSGELIWLIDFRVVCPWNKFGEKTQCATADAKWTLSKRSYPLLCMLRWSNKAPSSGHNKNINVPIDMMFRRRRHSLFSKMPPKYCVIIWGNISIEMTDSMTQIFKLNTIFLLLGLTHWLK